MVEPLLGDGLVEAFAANLEEGHKFSFMTTLGPYPAEVVLGALDVGLVACLLVFFGVTEVTRTRTVLKAGSASPFPAAFAFAAYSTRCSFRVRAFLTGGERVEERLGGGAEEV